MQGVEPTTNPLIEALEFSRHFVPNADNLGETGDLNDLYFLVDEIIQSIRRVIPESLCAAGCETCCSYPVALFNITPLEWQLIEKHLDASDPEWLEPLLKRFSADFGRRKFALHVIQGIISLPLPMVSDWGLEGLGCPFLEDGKCSIYSVRPLFCRMFGAFTVTTFGANTYYSCSRQEAVLKNGVKRESLVELPSANPLGNQLVLINKEKLPRQRFLGNLFGLLPTYPTRMKEWWLWEYAKKRARKG